jgi:predicted RNase H-like nuclease
MHPFEFALALVAMVMLFRLIRALILRKNPTRREDTVNADLLARLNQVEERVRVLEKIVTDERYDLRQQFKDLGA